MLRDSNFQRDSTSCDCMRCMRAKWMIALLFATLAKPYKHGDYNRITQLERMLGASRGYEEND